MAIIKCPECGHEVSDQAPRCPFCGVEIENNIITCPDCGKVLLKKDKTCPNCGCVIAPTATPEAKKSATSYRSYPNSKYPETKVSEHKNHNMVWIVLAIVIILGLIVGGYSIYQHQNQKEGMEQAYQALQNDTETADYEDFLQKYPQSPYIKDVTDRMNQLKAIQNKWTEISLSSSKSDFVQFMNQFPNSAYENACKQKIDSLDWVDASTENSAISYQRYIDEHPNGKYASEAQMGKENIDKMTVSYSDKSAVHDAITRYFEALTNNDNDALGAVVSDKMYDQSVSFMQKLHNGNQQVSFTVNGSVNVTKAPNPTTEFIFVAKYRMKRTVTSNAGEVTNVSYNAISTVSPDMRIVSTKMQKIDEE
jgi:outer membrane protein assembly factor BamD (BamD/ComL family)